MEVAMGREEEDVLLKDRREDEEGEAERGVMLVVAYEADVDSPPPLGPEPISPEKLLLSGLAERLGVVAEGTGRTDGIEAMTLLLLTKLEESP